MTAMTERAKDVFAPVDSAGNARGMDMGQAQRWGILQERMAVYGAVSAATKTALDAITPASGTYPGGVVLGGSEAGFYAWNGSDWGSKVRGFPDTAAKLTNVGGTADAITADTATGVDPGEALILILTPSLSNLTGAVTLALNGGSAESVKSGSGGNLAAGDLAAGTPAMLVRSDDDTEWRLIWKANVADRAEAAQAAAESAAAIAQAGQAARLIFDSAGELAAADVPDGTTEILLSTGGRSRHMRCEEIAAPFTSKAWRFSSNSGAKGWQLSEDPGSWDLFHFLGGKADGVNSDHQAILDGFEFATDGLFANVGGFRCGAINLPPRQIVLEEQVVWNDTTSGGLANNYINLGLIGVPGATKIIVPTSSNTDGAIRMTIDDKRSMVRFCDIDFIAKGAGAGQPVYVSMPVGGSVLYRAAEMRNCTMRGYVEGTDYFNKGAELIAWRVRLQNNFFRGPHGAGVSSGTGIFEDNALQYTPDEGFKVISWVPQISQNNVWACKVAYKVNDSTPLSEVSSQAEGGWCTNNQAVNVQAGMQWIRTEAREPQFCIDGFHCNFRDYGIYADGIQSLWVHKAEMGNVNVNEEGTGPNPVDIFAQNALETKISDCEFYFAGDPNRTHIAFGSGSNGTLGLASRGLEIYNNLFDATGLRAIDIPADMGRIVGNCNRMGDAASYSAGVVRDLSGKFINMGVHESDVAGVTDKAYAASFPAKRIETRFSSTPANGTQAGRTVYQTAFSTTAAASEVISENTYLENTSSLSAYRRWFVTRGGTPTNEAELGGGLLVGAATGGRKGTGTINATSVYDDNVLLTCYVIMAWLLGKVDTDFWDEMVLDRVHPAIVEFVKKMMEVEIEEEDPETGETIKRSIEKEVEVEVEVEPEWTEIRNHEAARGFAKVFEDRLDPDKYADWVREHGHLPAFPGPDHWQDLFSGKMATGDLIQRLWETVEVQFVHLAKTRDELKALEERIASLEERQ